MTPIRTKPSTRAWSIAIVVSGGAYFTAFSIRCSRIWRSRGASARAWWREPGPDLEVVLADDRPDRVDDLVDRRLDVGRGDRRGLGGDDPDGRQDRVDEPVEPLDLVHRRVVPRLALGAPVRVARLAALERRIVAEQLRVGPDDRERRPQLVGDERDQLGAGLVDLAELLEPLLGLGLLAALLDDPGEQVGDRLELGDVGRREVARLLGLDVEDADDLVVPAERHAEHRGDEPALVDAADPQEARVGPDVGDDERLARLRRRGR